MILVTGATGLSGSAIVREFSRRGTPVRALIRSRTKASALGLDRLAGVELVDGDMLRPPTLGTAFDGVNRVLMISAARERMVDTQSAFIEAARQAGVRHIVKFSGAESGVGFEAEKFRGTRDHEEIERQLEKSGLAWTHLRPSQFMQMYLREPPTVAAMDALVRPMEDARLSPVDIEDIAKVAYALLRDNGHEGKSYDMTGPEALTMSEIAERISSATGNPVPYVKVTPDEYRRILAEAGVPPVFADLLDEIYVERRRWTDSRVHLDTHRLFGVHPTTFADFAARHAAEFRGSGPQKSRGAA
jgi:uncharacterized protein YbjT (DUF2867 family)